MCVYKYVDVISRGSTCAVCMLLYDQYGIREEKQGLTLVFSVISLIVLWALLKTMQAMENKQENENEVWTERRCL